MKIKKIIVLISVLFVLTVSFANVVHAHCPLCVAGAGAGLSLSRILGIDDSITGVWIAAFIGATALWTSNSLKKKFIPFQETAIYLSFLGLTLWSFYQFNLISEHAGYIMGIHKLTFGILVGGGVFYLVDQLNRQIRKKNGKVLFPYQGVIFSLASMLILSMGIFIFINYYI